MLTLPSSTARCWLFHRSSHWWGWGGSCSSSRFLSLCLMLLIRINETWWQSGCLLLRGWSGSCLAWSVNTRWQAYRGDDMSETWMFDTFLWPLKWKQWHLLWNKSGRFGASVSRLQSRLSAKLVDDLQRPWRIRGVADRHFWLKWIKAVLYQKVPGQFAAWISHHEIKIGEMVSPLI